MKYEIKVGKTFKKNFKYFLFYGLSHCKRP